MTPIIRKSEASDEQAIKLLIKEFKEYESAFEEGFKTDLSSVDELYATEMVGDDKFVYIAEVDQSIVGFISFEKSTKNDPLISTLIPAIYVSGLFVKFENRGRGIAKKFMDIAETYAKDHNIEFLKLLLFTNNKVARDFYSSIGYEDYETTMVKRLEK